MPSSPERESRGFVVWLTGSPAAGKTTISNHLALHIREILGVPSLMNVIQLDGDTFRPRFKKKLGHSKEDRDENIHRAGAVAAYLGFDNVVIASFVSPHEDHRNYARDLVERFLMVEVDCPQDVRVERDPKGLYARAISGEIKGLTGWDAPHDSPSQRDLLLNTHLDSVDTCVQKIINICTTRGWL